METSHHSKPGPRHRPTRPAPCRQIDENSREKFQNVREDSSADGRSSTVHYIVFTITLRCLTYGSSGTNGKC